MWGWNVYGQCGLGLHVENQLTPVLVEQLRGTSTIEYDCPNSIPY
jgi:alpha-tubulin suppressor-like RCC1 family protein